MDLIDLVMPKMGESIMEATVLKWHKKPGDAVQQDETVLEIATDKVDTEVPSNAEGIIEEIFFKENDVVAIGSVIARIRQAGQSQNAESSQALPGKIAEKTLIDQTPTPTDQKRSIQTSSASVNRFYSPLVMNIASSEGISMTEMERIPGTGTENRVTKRDILDYLHNRTSGVSRSEIDSLKPTVTPEIERTFIKTVDRVDSPILKIEPGANVEIIEMDRMRKLIAKHMVDSVHISPHVTSFTEADVTNLVLWRERVKNGFEKREGTKLTFTPLFIEAIIRCIKNYPLINSSLDGDRIIVKKDINIGMAAALPTGNLIVPVIKNADQLNLTGLARQVNTLADNARNNKLKPEDIQNGTFTLTNVGTFGSLMGTPIINQPQVAILAVGAIKKRPVVIETAQGDSIAIRHMMYLSMSYDHRIVDGSLGATFLTSVARELENFDSDRQF
ncbi:MAG: 2-oxo acid dehydrogenase subunit E2 [Chitinophagaceae bacterium]|nr:2-oxo acid dehydrogenase subunit E2 [Chitinophagaceae bacterium]